MAAKKFNSRTARNPQPSDKQYVVIEDAPLHYISGFGLVGPGALVSLGDDVKPGKWLAEVSASEAKQAAHDEGAAAELASAKKPVAEKREASAKG